MMVQELSLVEWHKKVQEIAKPKGFDFLISDDPADHVDGFNEGNTPKDEFDDQLAAWSGD